MKKKHPFLDFSPFDIDSIQSELRNYNCKKVNLFIGEAYLLLWTGKYLKWKLLSRKKKDLKGTIRKLQKIGQYIYSLHEIEPIDQRYYSDTQGKRAIEITDLQWTKRGCIEELIKALEKLILSYRTGLNSLKTKTGRSTADESNLVTEIARSYLKYIDEPRQDGGHFKNVLSLILDDAQGEDRTRAIREARKKLKLLK